MKLKERLFEIATFLGLRIDNGWCEHELSHHKKQWLDKADDLSQADIDAALFRGLLSYMSRMSSEAGIAHLPLTLPSDDEISSCILMTAANVTDRKALPTIVHMRCCRAHREALQRDFSVFLCYVGNATELLETVDDIVPTVFKCSA